MRFIDTNIFLRYLTRDNDRKYTACLSLFRKAERSEMTLTTSESVIAEVVFVLSSKKQYNLPRKQIQIMLSRLLVLPGIRLHHHRSFIQALALYAQSQLDFEDCLTVYHMQREDMKTLYSYDTDFDRFENLKRVEP